MPGAGVAEDARTDGIADGADRAVGETGVHAGRMGRAELEVGRDGGDLGVVQIGLRGKPAGADRPGPADAIAVPAVAVATLAILGVEAVVHEGEVESALPQKERVADRVEAGEADDAGPGADDGAVPAVDQIGAAVAPVVTPRMAVVN